MKILIADDHRLVLEAVKSKLSELGPGIEFVLVMTVPELLTRIGECDGRSGLAGALDLALIDIQMPGAEGQRHILDVRRRCPDLPLIVLSGHDDPALMQEALEQGAQGFIPKAYSPEVLLAAVRLVLAGGVYVPPMMVPLNRQPAPLAQTRDQAAGAGADAHEKAALDRLHELLTVRQLDVLHLLSQGKPNKLIGRSLNISEGTVKIHLAAIFRALDVRNRTEAVIAARMLTQQRQQHRGTAPAALVD